MKPTVSIIISTYNRAKHFLPRALDSAISQTFQDTEIIVVDDCSTDNTREVVSAYAKKDKRILYVPSPTNFGSDTRPKNMGLLHAQGDYICYLDDDCEFHPYHVDVLYKAMQRNPKLDMVYGDMWLYTQDTPEWPGEQGIAFDFDAQFLLNRNYIDTSEVMHKKALAFAVGGFDERLPKFIDWNMWVRMMKWGAHIQRIPQLITNYYIHEDTKSKRVKTNSWIDHELNMTMFEPTFNPTGCYIYLPFLGNNQEMEKHPRVGIYTITYDRLEYTKRMYESLKRSTKYPFDWCVFDNGSKDGTTDWIGKLSETEKNVYASGAGSNRGISFASNYLLDKMRDNGFYQIIVKIDNDCEFRTFGWLEEFVDLWKRNHLLYLSPYPEGLIQNPGGGPRIGTSYIGDTFVEVASHIGGLCAFIDAKAYDQFRFADKFLHGNQDREASDNFRRMRYMPAYVPKHRLMHMDSSLGQQQKYPDYFERRKIEKTTQVEEVFASAN